MFIVIAIVGTCRTRTIMMINRTKIFKIMASTILVAVIILIDITLRIRIIIQIFSFLNHLK